MANPARPAPTTFEGRLLRRITELEARVAAVERGPRFEVGTAAPVNAVPDGQPYIDSAAPRLWLRAGGTWRYTVLT
jgi:hypothetical protein